MLILFFFFFLTEILVAYCRKTEQSGASLRVVRCGAHVGLEVIGATFLVEADLTSHKQVLHAGAPKGVPLRDSPQ